MISTKAQRSSPRGQATVEFQIFHFCCYFFDIFF
jgi:hypothetical protein